jgi:hypothetical protein
LGKRNSILFDSGIIHIYYILEIDQEENCEGSNALTPPWWTFFHFQLLHPLIDDYDSSIFGAMHLRLEEALKL